MIFLIKHRWWASLVTAGLFALAAWQLGGFHDLTSGRFSLPWQILLGCGGAGTALIVNFILHETFKRLLGKNYVSAFESYGRDILGKMRWPEYLAGGALAAIGEEPLFRGVILRAFDEPVLGIIIAALIFAACHWMSPHYLGFWLWALWEGMLMGILLVATGSLLVPIIAHGLHDVVAYIAFDNIVPRKTTTDT